MDYIMTTRNPGSSHDDTSASEGAKTGGEASRPDVQKATPSTEPPGQASDKEGRSETAEKDKPIDISTADDVDIDEDNPDDEEGASAPPAK
jgi:hypothetical protein